MKVLRQWSRLPLEAVESPSKPLCVHGDQHWTRSLPEMPSNLSWSWRYSSVRCGAAGLSYIS